MQLSDAVLTMEARNVLAPYAMEEHVQKMKEFMQHGNISTYQHCMNVVTISYVIAKTLSGFGLEIDFVALLIGAFLHDFYLYDWHTGRLRREGIHGFSHPLVAKANADKYFDLTDKELNIIESHMFPLTITHVPKSKEAVIVGIADKYCAIKETLCRRRKTKS